MRTLEELLAQLESDGVASLTDEELAQVRDGLVAVIDSVDDPANPSAEDIAALAGAADAADTVRAEIAVRETAAAERATELAELMARLRGTEATDEAGDGDGGEGADGDEATEGDGDGGDGGEPVETPPAEASDVNVEVNAGTEAAPVEAVADPVPVAAAARRPDLAAIARRRPSRARPEPARTSGTVITASADIPGIPAGQPLSLGQLDEAVLQRLQSIANVPMAAGTRYPVARIHTAFPEDRRLSASDAARNQELVDAVTAAGGPCAPLEVDYSIGVIGTAERPLRASLPQFNAARGGVRFQQPPQIGDYDAGVSVWTQATDASANALNGVTTKPCVRIDCGDEVTALTEAIPVCGTIGNWISRNFDERVQAFRSLLSIEAARFTESRHLAVIGAGSTQISASEGLGATRDVLAVIDRAEAGYRDRYRMADSESIDVYLHRWVRRAIRTDLAREAPGSSAERLATADATIDSFFAVRNLNPVWLLDDEDGVAFGAQPDGTLRAWPDTAVLYMFPSGSWKHLDDGVLDLSVSGPIRDSTLNASNDSQIWMETFENVYFQGTWSARIEMDICPSGRSSLPVSFDPCTTGS